MSCRDRSLANNPHEQNIARRANEQPQDQIAFSALGIKSFAHGRFAVVAMSVVVALALICVTIITILT